MSLSISRERFTELYPDIADHYDFYNDELPQGVSTKEFERRYLSSKLWRLNHLYKIVNKQGDLVVFRMNESQHVAYAAARQHSRLIILKSRQQGISTLWLISFFDDMLVCPNLTIGLMAQGTDEAATLLERTKLLWDHVNPNVKAFFKVSLDKDNMKKFSLTNDSSIFIRVSFRSATLQRLHISEFGKIANANPGRAKETKTGTLQTLARGMTGIIESTAEGKNEFKSMWDAAVIAENSGQLAAKDFRPIFLSWIQDPDCVEPVKQNEPEAASKYFAKLYKEHGIELTQEQKNFWIVQYRELVGDVYQEYPATPEEAFTASRDGTYYARIFKERCVRKGKVLKGMYDPNLPMDVFMDLGVDDYFVVAMVQWHNNEWRIIREYWNNGYALSHYLEWILKQDLPIRAVRFPHDIMIRDVGNADSNGEAKSRLDVAKEWVREHDMPWRLDVLPRTSVEDGIELVRRMIPNMTVDPSCKYIIDCLLNYSKKYDDRMKQWMTTPLHDEYSHGADVLRMMASSTRESAKAHRSRLAPVKRSRNQGVAL